MEGDGTDPPVEIFDVSGALGDDKQDVATNSLEGDDVVVSLGRLH